MAIITIHGTNHVSARVIHLPMIENALYSFGTRQKSSEEPFLNHREVLSSKFFLAKLGSQCLSLVTQASDCLKTDPHKTQRQLQLIKRTIPPFLEQLKNREKELEKKRDDLELEEQV